jgi:lysophospholipase
MTLIDRRRTLPPGGQTHWLTMADGWRLRAMTWSGQGRGSLLLLTGRADFIEKYAETLHDLADAGWALATIDWRGQGLSGRMGKTPMHGHADDFRIWRQDLARVMDWFQRTCPEPHHIIAHSMGGHLLLHHLADHPEALGSAVLLAPMLGLKASPLGFTLSAALARLMVALGKSQDYVKGGGPYGTGADMRQPLLTSDRSRFEDEIWWVTQNPRLALGSATWGWLAAAALSIRAFEASRLRTPLLVLLAEREGLVDNQATRRTLTGHAVLETIPGAAHEILRETSDIRTMALARINAYLQAS